jgi:4-hydroxy-tetrahydrodipicolinate reductase
MLAEIKRGFALSFQALADAIAMPLDRVEVQGECARTRNAVHIAAGVLDAGMMGAQRVTVTGMRGDRALMRMRLNWYCTRDIDQPSWDLRESGWRVVVEGDTPLDVSIRYPVPIENYAAMTPGLTAHRAVNAVPVVCAAPPGIRTTPELPQVIAQLGQR